MTLLWIALLSTIAAGVDPFAACPEASVDSLRWAEEIAHDRALGLLSSVDSSPRPTHPAAPRAVEPNQSEWDLALRSGRSLSQVAVPFVPSGGPASDQELVLLWNDVENFGFIASNCWRRFQCATLQKSLQDRGVSLQVCRTKVEIEAMSPP